MCGGCWNGVWKRTRRSGCGTSGIWSCCWRTRPFRPPLTATSRFGRLPWIAAVAVLVAGLGVALWALWRANPASGASAGAAGCRSGRGCFLAASQPGARWEQRRHLSRWDAAGICIGHVRPSCSPGGWINRKPLSSRERRGHPHRSSRPDRQWIGFQIRQQAEQDLGGRRRGGPAGLTPATPSRASWGEDGNILRGRPWGRAWYGFPTAEARPRPSRRWPRENSRLAFPQILPGGKAVLFSAYTALNADASSIEVMTLADHHRKTVSRGGTSPRYLATSNGAGYLVYHQQGNPVRGPVRSGQAGNAWDGPAHPG